MKAEKQDRLCEVCNESIDLKSWKRHQDKHKSE